MYPIVSCKTSPFPCRAFTLSLSRAVKALTFTGVVSLPVLASAQNTPDYPRKPLLWKIEGNGLTRPSYLFGTIHVGKASVCNLHPAAQQAFDLATAVYTEIPIDRGSRKLFVPLQLRTDGKKLEDALGSDRCTRLDEALKFISPKLGTKQFQPLATWAVTMSLQMMSDESDGHRLLDFTLWDKARAADKWTAGLETGKEHFKAFTTLTEQEQLILLDETMKHLEQERKEGKKSLDDLIAAYLAGEPSRTADETCKRMQKMAGDHRELREKLTRYLLTYRNKTMAATIASILKNEPRTVHFFAVGAGHLCSDFSIRTHLEKEGYTITRVGN